MLDIKETLEAQDALNQTQADVIEKLISAFADLSRQHNELLFRVEVVERSLDMRGGLGQK